MALRYNPKHFSDDECEVLLKVLIARMGKHELLSKEAMAFSATPDAKLSDQTAATVRITRKHMRVGTTAQDVAKYLGTALEASCGEGNLKGLHTRTEVYLGRQQGTWPKKKR